MTDQKKDTMPAQRFTKKSVTIEAIQFSGRWEDAPAIIAFTGGQAKEVSDLDFKRQYLVIDTLEGRMNIAPKDWVIKGIKGEYYPCKPDIFEATYTRAQPVADDAGGGERPREIWVDHTAEAFTDDVRISQGLTRYIRADVIRQPAAADNRGVDVEALDEISEALQTLLDNSSRKAYDDLGKIYQSAQSRVDDLRELQSHVAAHDVVDLEAIKRELRGVIFPYSAVEKVIDHLAARGLLRTTPENGKGDGWMPIETAPKDGTIILLSDIDGNVCAASYRENPSQWWAYNNSPTDHWGDQIYATHWMPLPAPPSTQQPEHEGE